LLDPDQLVLDPEVRGSLAEQLILHGRVDHHHVAVVFAAEILDHWPREIQRDRLNEMHSFIEAATRRALARRRFSIVTDLLPGDREALLVLLTWADIAS
jgi:hypothetical protein